MNKLMGIYAITCVASGKQYIGSSIDINNRFYHHRWNLNKNTHHTLKLQNAWNKYGEGAFHFHILDYVEDEEELLTWEQQWIDSLKPFYNINPTASNRLGSKCSEESKRTMALVKKGNTACLGRVLSQETRNKISKALKGKKLTEERKERLRVSSLGNKSNTGRKLSAETKAKMSATRLGKERRINTVKDEKNA